MKKDENGPNHWAEIQTCKIDGVRFQKSPIVKYSAGLICEVKNKRWENLYEGSLEHIYLIYDDTLSEREWGMHKETTDRYSSFWELLLLRLVITERSNLISNK